MPRAARNDPAMLKIAALELGRTVAVAVPLDDTPSRAEVQALRARGLDVAELRVDAFASRSAASVLAELAKYDGIPTLATIRSRAEGGAWAGREAEREKLFLALLPHVGAIDVELAAPALLAELGPAAREAGCLLIASHHDFERTPEPSALADLIARAHGAGADVVKIAAAVRAPEDIRTLAAALLAPAEIGRIVIGMGEAGLATRVLFPALGSLVSYAHAGRSTAPGQLPLDELVDLLRRTGLRA